MSTFNLTADGSTAGQTWFGSYEKGQLPEVIIIVSGTFGGGTVTVDYSADDGDSWQSEGNVSISAAGSDTFKAHPDLQYRATLASSTDPDLDVTFVV